MPWIRIDDHAPEHPKMLRAGESACWLWVCGLAYCSRLLTDGAIPSAALGTMGVRRPDKAAAALVIVGLWDQTPTGYQVHDYHQYQPSRGQVTERRKQTADRVAEWKRRKGHAHGNAPTNAEVTPLVTRMEREGNAPGNDAPVSRIPYPVPDPVPKEPVRTRAVPLGAQSEHRSHALCGRICLPAFLYREFIKARGGPEDEARRDVDAWALAIIQALPDEPPIGDDPLKFWRARWQERFGTTRQPTRTSASPLPSIYDDDWCQHDPRCNSREWHALTMQVPG